MTSAALYARVSTQAQVRSDPWASLTRQVDDLRALASRMGLDVALEEVEQGSGARADRPGWLRILHAVETGQVGAVLAVAVDRLTRSPKLAEFEAFKEQMRRLGCRVITIREGELDLSGSATAEFASDIHAARSKMERGLLAERTHAAKKAKARSGGYTGSPVPYGYRPVYDATTGKKSFAADEAQAEVVRNIFARYLDGAGAHAIAASLNDDGIPAPRGGAWSVPTVRTILANMLYGGIVEIGKTKAGSQGGRSHELVMSADFPALVSVEQAKQAADERARRKLEPVRFTNAATHPLSGLLRCGACGSRMHCSMGRAVVYRCSRSVGGGCQRPLRWNAQSAEDAVRAELVRRLAGTIIQGEGEDVDRSETDAEVEQTRRRIEALEAEEVQLVRLLGQGVFSQDVYSRARAGVDAELGALRSRLARLQVVAVPALSRHERLAQLAEAAALLRDPSLKRGDLRDLFVSLVDAVWLERRRRAKGPGGRWLLRVQRLDLVE